MHNRFDEVVIFRIGANVMQCIPKGKPIRSRRRFTSECSWPGGESPRLDVVLLADSTSKDSLGHRLTMHDETVLDEICTLSNGVVFCLPIVVKIPLPTSVPYFRCGPESD